MATDNKLAADTRGKGTFTIEGRIQREQADCQQGDMQLAVYAYDKAGTSLGKTEVDAEGNYQLALRLRQPQDVVVLVAPPGDAQQIRHSSAFRKTFAAKSWEAREGSFRLRHDALLPLDVWRPWWPLRICISGHVRKLSHHDGITDICPVPFVKVEIFDVDRESCLWPLLQPRLPELVDRPVIRLPELIEEPRFPRDPIPGPDPAPFQRFNRVALNPQPLPPKAAGFMSPTAEVAFNPQPDPPRFAALAPSFARVGEVAQLDNALAASLDELTVTSKIAPWLIFPHCFYSKAEVCQTTTDCSGYFSCCFNWYPFHFRRGRLRFDSRPDIIIKVTQVINGVPTVIYLDPYTSTRWNSGNAHIDLFLDNEEVRCGSGCTPQPEGAATFFTLVGHDEVYKIDQASGKFGSGSYANWAYGGSLLLCGVFGDTLSSGAPKRYYRLSYKSGLAPADPNDNADFVPIVYPLSDTRVNKVTFDAEDEMIGPKTVNSVGNLYEIRNTDDYYWYNPDKIGWWTTEELGLADGLYTVRLEVFNELGVKLTSAAVNYRDGTQDPVVAMTNRCDLVMLVDNKHPVLGLNVPGASGTCGVVPFSAVPGLTVHISVDQAHDRLRSWGLSFVKGITGGSGSLGGDADNGGILPVPVVESIPATLMTEGLTGTCAFALTLGAWPLVRNGFGAIHHASKTIAVAIEKCAPCEACD